MNDPALALYQYITQDDAHLRYLSPADREEYQVNQDGSDAALGRLQAALEGPSKKLLDIFLDEKGIADSIEAEALFTAGLALGLQLLRLS